MRAIAATLMLLASAGSAVAQTAVVPVQPPRFASAPWWMDQPVIASTGLVKTDLRANRAQFSATFQIVAKSAAEATKAVADKVRTLGQQLAAYGVEKVQVETTLDISPLYDQYRDKEGKLIDNERADKISAYEANAFIDVSVRDVALIERVYATVVAAQPTSTDSVDFSLDPDNETNTELYGLAVADAARRAKMSAEATGAKLGAVKLIDPTGRACNTDVLVAGARQDGNAGEVQDVVVVGARAALGQQRRGASDSIVADDIGSLVAPDVELLLQPPLRTLNAKACVVYSLLP